MDRLFELVEAYPGFWAWARIHDRCGRGTRRAAERCESTRRDLAGLLGDAILVKGNTLDSVLYLQKVEVVMKGGVMQKF